MGTALMQRPTALGALVPQAVEPRSARVRPLPLQTGLGAPAMREFRARLDTMLRHVAELWPRADVVGMRSALLVEALREPDLTRATDDSVSAFLLVAAESRLAIGKALTPIVDREARTGLVTVAAVEKVAGLVQLMRDAGAVAVSSGTIYQADVFQHRFDTGDRAFTFAPNLAVRDRGPVVGFFAVIDLPRGAWQAKVLTVAEVEQLRRASATPEHRAWRDYFGRMGELCALRAIADWIPQGHLRPRDFGPFATERATPMATLDPDDPYAAAPAHATRDTADYEVTEEPLFASAREAGAEVLPGGPADLDGYGGCHLRHCPTQLLRRVRRWIDTSADRAVRYARLSLAIDLVLRARRATQDPTTGPDA